MASFNPQDPLGLDPTAEQFYPDQPVQSFIVSAGKVTVQEQDQTTMHDINTIVDRYKGISDEYDNLQRSYSPMTVEPFHADSEHSSTQSQTQQAVSSPSASGQVDGDGEIIEEIYTDNLIEERISSGAVHSPPDMCWTLDATQDTMMDSTPQAPVPQSPSMPARSMPHTVTQFAPLAAAVSSKIPNAQDMKTFHPDFLRNHLGGISWSYGLRFIVPHPGAGPVIPKNGLYYEMDPRNEPYLPVAPGQHGAKLTPFFNKHPSEVYAAASHCTYNNVPMFVLSRATNPPRFIYSGNYSQSRWSDRLDHDSMIQLVPEEVLDWWAKELASKGRPEFVTNGLKKHFFPMPVYDGSSIVKDKPFSQATTSEKKAQLAKDLKAATQYAKKFAIWRKETEIAMSKIDKEFIRESFDKADADIPSGLRLLWEYLECVDWDVGFYNTLVTVQSRDANYNQATQGLDPGIDTVSPPALSPNAGIQPQLDETPSASEPCGSNC